MTRFFHPNLNHRGRMARGVIGALLLIAGIIVAGDITLWGLILVGAGLFAIVEAISRWCVVRACGIKTKF
ncbi:MAG TPA: YgaP-like transmembrane domain [Candidatus Sulfopaludibacter sp.]|nr:YgaP-like transmembrane domain [Candidatus Sulfopaludibacter sp.]